MPDIRAFRKAHNLTQAELASKLKVTQAMVAEIEAGTTRPSPELAARISSLMSGAMTGSAPRGPYFGQR